MFCNRFLAMGIPLCQADTGTGKKDIYLPVPMYSVQLYSGNPMTLRISLILLLLACIVCTSGCMQPPAGENQSTALPDTSMPPSIAAYKLTLAQPEESAELIKMDTDIYNVGEVVEFVITNDRNHDLSCTNTPPSFSVRYQKGTGQWVTRMGDENTTPGNSTNLEPGTSTAPYRFITAGWTPGRYRIVTDCGISREILLRSLPVTTPAVIPCPAMENQSPYIRVNPVSDQNAGELFTITGTTNLAADEELHYSIFAISSATTRTTNLSAAKLLSSTTGVSRGSCGTNTWSVSGEIQIPGDYFIGISDTADTVSDVRRFTILQKARSTVTATIPEKINPPGITYG